MAYRSEAGKIGNKQNYKDLNMTQYPNTLDTRANNVNMQGWVNVGETANPNYVMAEYVNALIDSVMAIQRTLGSTPQVPLGTESAQLTNVIETKTVKDRLNAIEGGSLDERYGGTGWVYNAGRPTLSKHSHTGVGGHPNKIILTTEVTGKLPKININLDANTGLTGADIFVSKTNTKNIETSLNDMLSKTTGGTVQGLVELKGGLRSRTVYEAIASEFVGMNGATLVTDSATTGGSGLQAAGTTAATFMNATLNRNGLMYGRYVVGIRLKTNSLVNANLIRVAAGGSIFNYKGIDFKSSNVYQMIYLVFDHTGSQTLSIQKLATTGTATVTVDSIFIHPVHPAVFDY